MNTEEVYLTPEGYEELRKELEHLKTVERVNAAIRVKKALEIGDITDDPEFDSAKKGQAYIEDRIKFLEQKLQDAKIIDPKTIHRETIGIGSRVVLRDMERESESHYLIVSPVEANPLENKLSHESPVGQAIMNKKKGDTIEVQVPDGTIRYKIVDIEY